MTRRILPVVTAIVFAAAGALVQAQSGPPGDGEIRTTKDPSTNGTITSVTLVLSGAKGPLPMNMAIASAQKAAASAVSALRLEFNLSQFVGEIDTKTPHVEFNVDKGARKLTANVDATTSLPGRKYIQVPFDASSLEALALAKSVQGKAFGLEFILTARQIAAIQAFEKQVR